MKTPAENPREIVNRFLENLGEPLPPVQVERAIARVHGRLDDAEALSISVEGPRVRETFRWSVAVAALVVLLVGGAIQLVFLQPDTTRGVAKAVSGQIYFAESYSPLSIASRIEGGQLVRAGSQGGGIALLDGSRIELSPLAELSIVHASDGMRVRLGSGTVIVTAAKQRSGHLYVETKDLLVSVVGTVFSVSAEAVGSRVSVIEGEVHVQQGQNVQTLLPGQQASTSPALGPLPVETELKWSKSAGELVALLQQSTPVPSPVPAAGAQTVSRVLQGSVKLASKQEGIPGVTVTVCPASEARFARVRISAPGAADEVITLKSTETTTFGGPLVKNKAFFFLWNAAACPSPVQTRTDAAGRFQVQGLSPGDYSVRADIEGYFGPATNGNYPAFDTQQVTVDAQQPVQEVSLSLVRSGSISGRIRDSEGKLVANASVWAVPQMGGNAPATLLQSRITDDRGEYRLFGLPPGEYFVGAGPQGGGYIRLGGNDGVLRYFSAWSTPPGQASSSGQTFFPNAASTNDATPILLKEGEEVGGIDIVMRPASPTDPPLQRAPVLRR